MSERRITPEQAVALRAVVEGPHQQKSDLGNARRLVADWNDYLRFVPSLGWHSYNLVTGTWERDERQRTLGYAKAVCDALRHEAAVVGGQEGVELMRHAVRSEQENRMWAMLNVAATDQTVVVTADQLDADPWALNLQHHTLDLRAGALRSTTREDLHTKLAPVVFDPEARSPLWEDFISTVCGGDDELAAFLQRAVGYTLTGDTDEEKLFFLHGPEATGKTTFIEAIKSIMGSYAATADFETFLKKRGDGGARSDIARLAGARLVVGVEVEEGKSLAEGVVKQLTGGDRVTARFMYRDYFEFTPRFKLWLVANARPKVSAADGAMWRRIVQVPFTHTIPERDRDPELKRRLKDDPEVRAAVLAWAVKGVLEWQRGGLRVPQRVRAYTNDYRAENDPVADWMDECCTFGAVATETSAALRSSYDEYCQRNRDRPVSKNAFAEALRQRGCVSVKKLSGGQRGWRGIALGQGATGATGAPVEANRPTRARKGHFAKPSPGVAPIAPAVEPGLSEDELVARLVAEFDARDITDEEAA